MKFTPEQLATFASAGWSPDAIKEMLEYDTEVKTKLENNEEITPDDGINHITTPDVKTEEKNVSNEEILEKMLGGN